MVGTAKNVKRLQNVINRSGDKILYNTRQWYSTDFNAPVTEHIISRVIIDKKTEAKKTVVIYKTYSLLQVVLFLRDLLFVRLGRELPVENEKWNKLRGDMGVYLATIKQGME